MKRIEFILALVIALSFTSCKNYNYLQSTESSAIEDVESFNNGRQKDGAITASNDLINLINASEKNESSSYIIKQDDKLSISIWNHDDLSVGSIFGEYNSNEVYGKWLLVDKNGEVQLPKIGKVALAKKDITEAQNYLSKLYAEWIVDPIIVVKVLNREVTVLGEVKSAGNLVLEKEKNSLGEILARAGGTTDYADTRELVLIRDGVDFKVDLSQDDGSRLSKLEVKNGDMIYVPAQKAKNFIQKSPGLVAVSGVLSTIAIIVSVLNSGK